jgi:hypothetical protein
VVVRVVERLGDEDAGAGPAGGAVHDDDALDLDRLGERVLPEQPCLLGPLLEHVEVALRGAAVGPAQRLAVGQATQVAAVAGDDVAQGLEDPAVGADACDLELLCGEVLAPAEGDQLRGRPVVVPDCIEQDLVHDVLVPSNAM